MLTSAKKIVETKKRGNPIRSFIRFFGSVKQELKKISWTNKKDLAMYTKVILVSTFVVSFAIFLVDLCIQRSLQIVHLMTQWIFG